MFDVTKRRAAAVFIDSIIERWLYHDTTLTPLEKITYIICHEFGHGLNLFHPFDPVKLENMVRQETQQFTPSIMNNPSKIEISNYFANFAMTFHNGTIFRRIERSAIWLENNISLQTWFYFTILIVLKADAYMMAHLPYRSIVFGGESVFDGDGVDMKVDNERNVPFALTIQGL